MVALVAIALIVAAVGFRFIHQAQQQRLVAEARQTGIDAYRRGDLNLALQRFDYFTQHRQDDLEINLLYAEAQSRHPTPGARHLFDAVDRYALYVLPLLDDLPQTDGVVHQRRDVLGRLLNLYSQIGDRQRVEITADALLKIDPDTIDALAARGEVQFLSRRFDDAVLTAQRLIELDPDNLRWRKMLLETRTRQGATSAALVDQCRAWAAEYQGDARFRLLAAGMLVDAGRIDEARTELNSVAALGASSAEVLEQLVSLLDSLGLRDEGDAAVASSQNRLPHEAWVREVAIRRLWWDGRTDNALDALDAAQNDAVEPTPALLQLRVLTLIDAGRRAEALAAVQPMLELSAADRRLDADRAWAAAVAATLRNWQAGGASGWRAGVDAILAALAFSPASPVLHALMGDASLEVGEYSGAVSSFRQAWNLAPNWIAAGLAYGEVLRVSGRLEDAFQVSRNVLGRAAPSQPGPFLLFARCVLDLRDASINPVMPNVSNVTGEVITVLRQASDRPGKGEADLGASDRDEVITLLARAYLVEGDRESALILMRQSAANAGVSDVNVLVALAMISRDHGLGMEPSLLQRAREVGGLTPPVALALARQLASDGQSSAGLRLIDEAIAASQVPEGGNGTTLHSALVRRAMLARAAYLADTDPAAAMPAMLSLIAEQNDSIAVQQFMLAQPIAWRDPTLIARAMANLKRLLGEGSVQVRLAEAHFLIRNHAAEPPMLARAVTTLHGVLEEAPDSLAALSLSAEAEELSARVARLSADNRSTGDGRRAMGSIDRAVAHLERAVMLYPGEPDLLIRLISLLQQRGRFDDARRYLQRLAVFSEIGSAHADGTFAFAELRLLEAQGDFETALVRASALVNEQSPPLQQLLLALIEERAGRSERAEAIYLRLLAATEELKPSNGPVDPSESPAATNRLALLAQAAEFYASTGRFERGVELLRLAPRDALNGPAPDVLVGAFYARHGRLDEGSRLLRDAVRREPDSISARDELARCLLAQGDADAARDEAIDALRLDGEHVGLRTTLAIANLGGATGSDVDRQEAMRLLREIGAGNDALLAMLELLERVPIVDGRSRPSTQNLMAAREITQQHPAFLPVWQLAISLHVEAGRPSEAIAIAREALSALPGRPQPAEWATRLLMDAGRWNEAMSEAREWSRRSQNDPLPAECAEARSLIALGRASDALAGLRRHADRIVAERSQSPMHLGVLIEAMLRGGDVASARQIMTPLLSEDRRWRQLWIDGAALAPPTDAERILVEIEPIAPEPEDRLSLAMRWLNLAGATGDAHALDQAHTLAKSTADEPTTAVGAAIVLGGVAEMRGDWIAAERNYFNALNKAPDNAVALNNLASVMARDPNRVDEALPLIEKAIRLQPDQPDFLDTHAAVLLASGRPAEAVTALNRALELRPEDPSFMLALATAQLDQGRANEAAVLLDHVQRRPVLSHGQQQQLRDLRQRLQEAENTPSAAAEPTSTPE